MSIILLITVIFMAAFVDGTEEDSSTLQLVPCNEGWYLFGDKCYKVFGKVNPRKWDEASQICRNSGGHLVTIQRKELQDFLTTFLLLNEKNNLWIGLNDKRVESVYTWDDGSNVNYTNWMPNEPNFNLRYGEDCVEMIYKGRNAIIGKWNDIPCDKEFAFICQSNKTEQISSPDPRFCSLEEGGGWKYLNSCFHIVTKEKSWSKAEEYCQQNFQGHLVSIVNSKVEMFLNYVLLSVNMDFWIGIKLEDLDNQKWSSGWRFVYNRWDDEEELIKGDCGLKTRNLWKTDRCSEKYSFICEKSGSKPPVFKESGEGWRCPDSSNEWKDLGGDTCYIFETKKSRNWYQANYDCMTKGGALATIHSAEESDAIHQHVIETQDQLLIGLHRKLNNKMVFEWTDGTEIDFQQWDSGEPNTITEECGEVLTAAMRWNDIPCSTAHGYICSAKKLPAILSEENKPLVKDKLQTCQCPEGRTGRTVMITLVCVVIISILTGIVIYIFKTRCGKDIQFSSLREITSRYS